MAMNQNPSFSNPFNFYFGDETIHNGQTLSSHSYSTQKHVNGNGLTSSRLRLFFYFHLSGQLGFSQIVTEVRRTYIASNKVQIHSQFHSSIDYEFSAQNQLARLIRHGNISPSIQYQSNFINQILLVSNQANRRLAENKPFRNSNHHQNQQTNNKTPPIMNLDGHNNHYMDTRVVHDPTPVSTVYKHESHPSPEPLSIINLRNSNIGVPSKNQVGVSRAYENKTTPHTNKNSSDDDCEYDGRTHCLPCKKLELYKCPKCLRVFHSSQKGINKRLTAKNKRKNKLRLVYSVEGLNIVPILSVNKDPTGVPGQGMKNRVNVKKKDKVGVNDREEEDGPE
ncbi:hypothetical protein ACOSQ4_017248 [Xanthoceras sorbifolium]